MKLFALSLLLLIRHSDPKTPRINPASIIRRAPFFDFIRRLSEPYGWLKALATNACEDFMERVGNLPYPQKTRKVDFS
jgi:hypothetical protein